MSVKCVVFAILLSATAAGARDPASTIRPGGCSKRYPAAERPGRDIRPPVVLRRIEASSRQLQAAGFKCGDFLPVLEVVIGKDGRVVCASLIPPPRKQVSRKVAAAFEEAVAQWRFKPATKAGRPVESIMQFVINMRCA